MKTNTFALSIILIAFCFGCKEEGCTYPDATNFNPEATKDDGSCNYEDTLAVQIIQSKLVGSWSGNGSATFSGGMEWEAAFEIEEDGRYTGQVTSVQSGSISAVFNNGDDDLDHPEKKFVMQSLDAFDKTNGKVSFVHSNGDLMEYQIKDLVFSDDYEQVDFTVYWGAELTYQLIRN
jgi:hypothetical protein